MIKRIDIDDQCIHRTVNSCCHNPAIFLIFKEILIERNIWKTSKAIEKKNLNLHILEILKY